MDARKVHNYWHLGCLLLVTLGLCGCADQPIPPQQAVSEADTSTILQKIKAGYDVNSQDSNGYTALHWAAYSGQLSAAQVLVDHGAEIEALDNARMTPLLVAASYDQVHVAAYLVFRGANVNARDNAGWTPLAHCHGAHQNQPGRGASKPANVLTYSIPHPFYPTQLFLELLVPVHAVWPADTPTSEDNGGSVTVSSGGEHPSSPAVLRRPFGFVFSGVPDWPAVSEVEWPPCRRR